MDQNKIKKAHLTIPFHNDLFFKYMLVNNQALLERILKIVTGITFTIVSILNPAINSDTVMVKALSLIYWSKMKKKTKSILKCKCMAVNSMSTFDFIFMAVG